MSPSEIRTVFKVVNVDSLREGRTFFSAFVCSLDLVKQYRLGQKVFPDVGKLFAFDTFTNAKAVVTCLKRVILKCEAQVSYFETRFPVLYSCYTSDEYKVFWSLVSKNKIQDALRKLEYFNYSLIEGANFSSAMFQYAPIGTLFCDWIKPIEICE